MTPEERAKSVLRLASYDDDGKWDRDSLAEEIADAIAEAWEQCEANARHERMEMMARVVAEEREACLAICREVGLYSGGHEAEKIADCIRARGIYGKEGGQ